MTTATTIFEVGKLAWLIENDRITSKKINRIRITIGHKGEQNTEVQISKNWTLEWCKTTNMFPTKEALIASL